MVCEVELQVGTTASFDMKMKNAVDQVAFELSKEMHRLRVEYPDIEFICVSDVDWDGHEQKINFCVKLKVEKQHATPFFEKEVWDLSLLDSMLSID